MLLIRIIHKQILSVLNICNKKALVGWDIMSRLLNNGCRSESTGLLSRINSRVSQQALRPASPDDQRAALRGRHLDTEALQLQQVVGGQLVGLLGRGAGQPAVVGR